MGNLEQEYKGIYPLLFELFTSYCAMKFYMSGSMGFGKTVSGQLFYASTGGSWNLRMKIYYSY